MPTSDSIPTTGFGLSHFTRGELELARETAESFLGEAEKGGRATETALGRRILGLSCLQQGDFAEAHANFEQALTIHDPGRDREARFRFGTDTSRARPTSPTQSGNSATCNGRWTLIEEAISRGRLNPADVPTLAQLLPVPGASSACLRGHAMPPRAPRKASPNSAGSTEPSFYRVLSSIVLGLGACAGRRCVRLA